MTQQEQSARDTLAIFASTLARIARDEGWGVTDITHRMRSVADLAESHVKAVKVESKSVKAS